MGGDGGCYVQQLLYAFGKRSGAKEDVVFTALVKRLQQKGHENRIPAFHLRAVYNQLRGSDTQEVILQYLEIPVCLPLNPVAGKHQDGTVPIFGQQFKSWGLLTHAVVTFAVNSEPV